MKLRLRDLIRRVKELDGHSIKRGKARRRSFRAFWRKHPQPENLPRRTRRQYARAFWKTLGKGRQHDSK